MPRRSRALLASASAGLALTLLVSACGDTTGTEALTRTAAVAHPDDVNGWVEDPTTTTVAPTTTAAPTTTTAAPPPPTTAPPAVRTQSATRAVAPAPAPAPAAAPTSSCTEAGMLAMINRERARPENGGLPPLQLRGGASQVACSWSKHMASAGLGHNGNLSGDLAAHGVTGWRSIGENVGQGGSASHVFSLFMGSGGHRANILKGAYTQVGIGVVTSGSKVWVTLDFVGY